VIDYHDRRFRSVANTPSGDVAGETTFHYRQRGDVVWGTYEGERVRFGPLIARIEPDGRLDVRYQHVTGDGELKTGVCRSTPEVLPDGRLRLHESWRWTSEPRSAGESIVEEFR
jgi:hypothetical protein